MELQVFNNDLFGEIRVGLIDNEPWFVARDVVERLQYNLEGNSYTKYIKQYVSEEDTKKLNKSMADLFGIKDAGRKGEILINEFGLYDLVLDAPLPSAKAFRKWITHEVLPSIRANGGYILANENETDEEIMAKALLIAQKTIENKNKLIEELKPKAEKYTTIYNSDNLYKTTDVAKDLGMSATKLNKILNEKEIIFKKGTTWYFYSKYEHMIPEYADYIINEYGQQLRWTNKGREFIIDLLNK